MIYESLLRGNKTFGSNPDDICLHVFKCEPEEINEYVVITPWWRPDIFPCFADKIDIAFDGEHCNVWNIKMDGLNLTYIRTGLGAPLVGDIALALGCTPCKKAIFIGSAGALDTNMGIGDIVIPELSICGDGFCRYLTKGQLRDNDVFGKAMYPNAQLFEKIKVITDEICTKNNVKWHIGKNFSVDTIFAQFSHLDEIRALGCTTIEMETAAFFKATEICNIAAGAIFSVSDNSIKRKSLYSGRTEEEMQYREKVRANYIPQIVIKSLLE